MFLGHIEDVIIRMNLLVQSMNELQINCRVNRWFSTSSPVRKRRTFSDENMFVMIFIIISVSKCIVEQSVTMKQIDRTELLL